MKRALVLVALAMVSMGLLRAAFRSPDGALPPLTQYVPAGALVSLEARDFAGLVTSWNASDEKNAWLRSGNFAQFQNSRLLLRLKDAGAEFAAAAGLPPDAKFLGEIAGRESVVGLYDIGNLEFLYIARLGNAGAIATGLWQSRAKFEARSLGPQTFYVRRDPESGREVAFAAARDYLLLATREDLLAGALKLLADGQGRSIRAEEWWSGAVQAAGGAGDLRLVLNLDKIVPSPYFRSYWIQKNITEMKQYSAAVSDLFRAGREYREERVLVRKMPPAGGPRDTAGAAALGELAGLVPADAGAYQLRASPPAGFSSDWLENRLLLPQPGAPPAGDVAPPVPAAAGAPGSSADLETRIDEPPVSGGPARGASGATRDLFVKNAVRASLAVQSSEPDGDGVFVGIHKAVVFLGEREWKEPEVQDAVVEFLRPQWTAGQAGLGWQARDGSLQLDGLFRLGLAVRGKYLVFSDDPALLSSILRSIAREGGAPAEKPAVFLAGFRHDRERWSAGHLFDVLEGRSPDARKAAGSPQSFFADNLSSFSAVLGRVSAEKIVRRDAGDRVFETVTYEWSR